MTKPNKDLRDYARSKGVFIWQIADKLGICPNRMSIRLRKPFSDKQRAEYIALVDELAIANADEDTLLQG